MNPTRPGKEQRGEGNVTPNTGTERSSAGDRGGAPATEEDIGTEGAGTEPRQTVDVGRDTDTARRKSSDHEGAP